MSLIIIEGCDGSGKTTFAQQLSHIMPDDTVALYRKQLKRDPVIEYIDDLSAYDPAGPDYVCDRWHVGEMVYGPLYRGECRLTPAQNLFIDMFLASRGALKLWMNTPFEIVRSQLAKRGEDFLQEQHQRLVVDWYAEALGNDESWISVPWKYTPDFVTKLVTLANAHAASAQQTLSRYPSYVGSMNPSVLVVGTQKTSADLPVWPFNLVPWKNSPTHSILTAMTLLNITQVGLYSDMRNVRQLWEALMRPIVFALDKREWAMLYAMDIPAQLISLPPRGIPIMQLAKTLMERI